MKPPADRPDATVRALPVLCALVSFLLVLAALDAAGVPGAWLVDGRRWLQGPERADALTPGRGDGVLLAGDSGLDASAPALAEVLVDTAGGQLRVDRRVVVGTSLSTPELFDWPAALARITHRHQYAMVFVMVGPASTRGVTDVAGRRLPVGSPRWRRWAARAANDVLDAAAAPVVWLQRPTPDDGQSRRVQREFTAVLRRVARRDGRLVLASIGAHLSSPRPGRAPMFQPDGVHLTPAGADAYARAFRRWLGDQPQVVARLSGR